MKNILPQDLLKFGLIPEFVGRLPILVTLQALDKQALIQILTEPKNALIKQYQKLLEMDDVLLEFSEEALSSIAEKAIARSTGARGLRAIIEEIMLDVMFDIPSSVTIEKCVINKNTVENKEAPELTYNESRKSLRKTGGKKPRSKKESVS